MSAHYVIRTRDGVGIRVFNRGLRHAAPEVFRRLFGGKPPGDHYFRTTSRFEAPAGAYYEWLNGLLFVFTAERERQAAPITPVYQPQTRPC